VPDHASSFSPGEQLSFLTKHPDRGTNAVDNSKRSKHTISWELDNPPNPGHSPLGPLSTLLVVGVDTNDQTLLQTGTLL